MFGTTQELNSLTGEGIGRNRTQPTHTNRSFDAIAKQLLSQTFVDLFKAYVNNKSIIAFNKYAYSRQR